MITVFNDREHAEAAIAEMQALNIVPASMSIAAGEHHHRSLIDRLGMSDTPILTGSNLSGQEANRAAEHGLRAGAGLGAAVGLLAGIPLFLATGGGVGLLVAGTIAAAMGGGVSGAAVGGLAGALIGMGLPRPKAEDMLERVHGGAVIVTVRAGDEDLRRIEEVFNRHEMDEAVLTAVGGAIA
jgi:hypothetical protein